MNRAPEIGCCLGARVTPGVYSAYCAEAHRYRDSTYKRWTCIVQFDLLDANQEVIARLPMWFNLGHGPKPHAGRKSRYFEAWARANGGQPPKRADRLPESVFLRRIAKVRVEEVNAVIPYSIVREILEWETGTVSTINKSIIINQQSIINNQVRHPLTDSVAGTYTEGLSAAKESEDKVPEQVSALAGVESTQHNPTQGRGGPQLTPQRHCMPKAVNHTERLAELRAQANELLARR